MTLVGGILYGLLTYVIVSLLNLPKPFALFFAVIVFLFYLGSRLILLFSKIDTPYYSKGQKGSLYENTLFNQTAQWVGKFYHYHDIVLFIFLVILAIVFVISLIMDGIEERPFGETIHKIWNEMIGVLLIASESTAHSAEKYNMNSVMKKLLPMKIEGYKANGRDEFYDQITAFRYMDGAAELYLTYNFKILMVRRYLKTNHPPILVELFDMGSSEDAFGIFSYQTDEEEVGIGQGSDYGGGLLRFWKGNYFINIFSERETPETKRDILTFGKAIAKNIKKEGKKPKLMQFLPEEGLSERTIRYFHHHQILNHHYFISHENILRLGIKTNAILATYLSSGEKAKTLLLLVQYPDPNEARKAFNLFIKTYLPEASKSNSVKTENGKWTSATFHQNYFVVVFDALSQKGAEELIEGVLKKINQK